MSLSTFIKDLLSTGEVVMMPKVMLFSKEDRADTMELLQTYYQEDRLHLPGNPPAFSEDAALWAAEYLYRAVQLTVVRELGEEKIKRLLPPFFGHAHAGAIYSADLCLRHLPNLFKLAKGLSPDDPLVRHLRHIGKKWPFSSVGMRLNTPPEDEAVLADPSLRIAYVDRIIEQKDFDRLKNHPALQAAFAESLGDHASLLCPDYSPKDASTNIS
jgi:hypothetical protein